MLELHDYQQEAVRFLQGRKRAALLLDMGLGKTAICLRSLTPDDLPALVVAPKRVAENVWSAERKKWRPDLTVAVAAGTPKKRKDVLASSADIIAIGRDNLADAVPYAGKFKTFIMDELSSFKSKKSNRWKQAKRISTTPTMKNVWGLTGTPMPNGLLDLWPELYLLDGGQRLGKTITGYRERYFTPGRQLPNGVITTWDPRPGAEKRIHMLIEDICLSMETDGKVQLPPVTYNNVTVPLPPDARKAYRKLKNDLVVDLKALGMLEGGIHSAATAGALSMRLRQICAGFIFVDDQDLHDNAFSVVHLEKVRTVREIIDGTGSPVMVGYQFRPELKLLQDHLGLPTYTVDTPDLMKRWNNGDIPVLLVHPDSIGHGLNMQEGPGCNLVWSSVPWGLEPYQQTNKRLNRQGQKNAVVIHHLICPFTVDEAIMQRQLEKKSVQDALLSHLESPI